MSARAFLRPIGFVLFIAVFVAITFFAGGQVNAVKPRWLYSEARDFIVSEMQNLCSEALRYGAACEQPSITGKSRWIASVNFAPQPRIDDLFFLVGARGWIQRGIDRFDRPLFCRGEYALVVATSGHDVYKMEVSIGTSAQCVGVFESQQ